jgi:hypothetical protein
MAKLSAHGTIVGTVERTLSLKRYMSDRSILVNRGAGWKLAGRVKAGVSPADAFEAERNRIERFFHERPEADAFRKALHKLAPLPKRGEVYVAISMMPDDPDGVWSTLCDRPVVIDRDLDDIEKLCRLFNAAQRAKTEMLAAQVAA